MSSHPLCVCLWFDNEAEAAARFYTSVFRDAEVGRISRYGKEGFEFHGKPEGSVMTVEFSINGTRFLALNGGPVFAFNESVSLQIFCDTQEEIDHYWNRLSEGGSEQNCGWLKDRYGLSWQVVPKILPELLANPANASRVSAAIFGMKKFVIADLQNA